MIIQSSFQQYHLELAERAYKEALTHTPEQALASLVDAGILDENGNYTENYPHLTAWQRKQKNNTRSNLSIVRDSFLAGSAERCYFGPLKIVRERDPDKPQTGKIISFLKQS